MHSGDGENKKKKGGKKKQRFQNTHTRPPPPLLDRSGPAGCPPGTALGGREGGGGKQELGRIP